MKTCHTHHHLWFGPPAAGPATYIAASGIRIDLSMCQNMSCIYIAEHFCNMSDPAMYIDLINRKRANSSPRISA